MVAEEESLQEALPVGLQERKGEREDVRAALAAGQLPKGWQPRPPALVRHVPAGGRQRAEEEEEEAEAEEEEAPEEQAVAASGEGDQCGEGAEEDPSDDDIIEEVEEHLKDAIEGSFRLKRMLDDEALENSGTAKRRKVSKQPRTGPKEQVKIRQLVLKWNIQQDAVTQHVLEGLTMAELEQLHESGYTPDKYNAWKSPAELLAMHVASLREKRGPGGGPLDTVSAFKWRWKLDITADKLLRKLSHRELRYVLREYNGETSLEEMVEEAAAAQAEEGNAIGSVVPDAPGTRAFGRFHRLEIIDPVSEAAVFGDANLTFALNLARHRKALGHVGRIVATTFETLETLQERYKEIDETIQQLEEHYAEVYHAVDCTRVAVDPRFKGLAASLGAVYYNFPHAGAISGFFDGHPLVNWRHENLMRLFFRALRSFMKPHGLVKVSSNMGAVGVRYSYIIESALENEFVHVETLPFLEWQLHRYGRSYGDRRDAYKRPGQGEGYNVQRAEADMVYTFEYRPAGKTLGRQKIRLPPTIKTIMACPDGAFSNLHGEGRKKLARDLYRRFIAEVSGTHVG